MNINQANDMNSAQPDELLSLAHQLVDKASGKHLRVGSAESCTGGMIAESITEVAGSSDVFMGAVVSYDNQVKQNLLAVDAQTLKCDGAVSEAVALQMAMGARTALNVDLAVSTTGIAGPGGGSREKPIGTVWIAVATPEDSRAMLYRFSGDRHQVRRSASIHALKMLIDSV